MKTTFQLLLCISLLLLVTYCGEKLEDLDPVNPVSLITGTEDTLIVTGQLMAVGDGIMEHGHVWSAENPIPTIEEDIVSELGRMDTPGSFSSLLNPIDPSKTYLIRGYAIDVHGCVYYGDEIIEIDPPEELECIADFIIIDNNCNAPCEVTFQNESSNATDFIWDFGDDSPTSTEPSPSHPYTESGSYTVRLTAISNGEECNSLTKVVNIGETITFEVWINTLNEAKAVVRISDGSYLVACTQNTSATNTDVVLVKVTEAGNHQIISENPYGLSDEDEVEDMVQLGSGGNGDIIMVGSTLNNNGDEDVLYIRVDINGNLITDNGENLATIGTQGIDEIVYSIIETQGGQIAMVGESSGNIFFSKREADLQALYFEKAINIGGISTGYDLLELSNGQFFIIGKQDNSSSSRIFLTKRDDFGNSLNGFPKFFEPEVFNEGFAISINSDNELILGGGSTSSVFSPTDIFLDKTDLNGEGISQDAFPLLLGEATLAETCRDLIILEDGKILIAGFKDGNAYLAKINLQGDIVMDNNEFGDNGADYFNEVIPTPDGGFVAVGSRNGDFYLVKTNAELQVEE